jgi:hypothetical protein
MALTYLQRSYAGGAVAGTLTSAIGSGTTSFTSSSALTGWTDITGLSFGGYIVVAVEYGTANEEKILCTFNGTTFTIVSRNYDGTNFSGTHASGSKFVLVYTAEEAAEANDVVQTMKTILTNTGTATSPANITVGGTASVGSGQIPAAIDHNHVIPSTSLSSWLATTNTATTNVTVPATNITSGALPTGVTASKIWSASDTTTVLTVSGYNNYLILARVQYAQPSSSPTAGYAVVSATVDSTTTQLGSNYLTASTTLQAEITGFTFLAAATGSHTVQLSTSGPTGSTASAKSIIVVGIN